MNARLKEVAPQETPAPRTVYQAIAAVMGDLAKRGISKDQTNAFDKYKFRGIDDLYNALGPLLARHGLLILPNVIERDVQERTSQKGGAVFYVTVTVEFKFVSVDDGSTHVVRTYGEAMDRGDKGTNKAITSAFKYACFEAFCIPVEGTDDADRETHEVQATAEAEAQDVQAWLDTIAGADTADALGELGKGIAAAKLSAGAKLKLRKAFADRKHALEATA